MKLKFINLILFSCLAFNLLAQCNLEIQYDLNGVVLVQDCSESYSEPMHTIGVESINGGSEVYSVVPFGNGFVSNTLVTAGNGFTYFYPESDHLNGNLGFTITDGGGDTCYLNNVINYQLSSVDFFCDSASCAEKIELDIEPGDLFDIYSCNGNGNFQIKVNNVTGGNGTYAITTLGLGTISVPNILNNKKFNYEITQSDIDTRISDIGFQVDDGENCKMRFDFSGQVAFSNIQDLCYVANTQELIAQNEIEIRPNIISQKFEIYNPNNRLIRSMKIFNINGSLVNKITSFPNYNYYALKDLSKGVYIVKFEVEDFEVIQKIIKN